MRNLLRFQHLYSLEAALVGLFFIQALRFLVGMAYSRVAGAAVVRGINAAAQPAGAPDIVDPGTVSTEITVLIVLLALPLFTLILGRVRWFFIVAVAVTIFGRTVMNTDPGGSFTPTMAASFAVGGALTYIAMLTRDRAQTLPHLFIFGLSIDQLLRAAGDTLDPSWSTNYLPVQVALAAIALVLSVINAVWQQRAASSGSTVSLDRGLITFWGAVGLGALLFLELSLFSLPNALAGRADADYTVFMPVVLLATVLPLTPWLRNRARAFISLFDPGVRGWVWMLVASLLIVIGLRIQNLEIALSGNVATIPFGGIALVIAALMASLTWWWLARPRAARDRNLTGLWLLATMGIFALLVAADVFTYEYAFVRDFAPPADFLNPLIPPLLRGFRGLGIAVILFAVFLASVPLIQTRRRVPWPAGSAGETLLALVFLAGLGVSSAFIVQPPLIQARRGLESMRVGTYNIHAGYSEFYDTTLDDVAAVIERSGADVILLQEIERGRLTSFGIDQPLWLARHLEMDTRFLPANEGLQGLAVLSKIPIAFDDGRLLSSRGNQTGLQRVQILPDGGVVTIYNTWLGLLTDAAGGRPLEEQEQDQQRQLTEIFAIIASDHRDTGGRPGRTIVGGTFNNIPDSPLIEPMQHAGFSDPFGGLPLELSATLRRTGRTARIDYLWTNSLLSLGAGVMESAASDHRMAVAEVQLARRVE